MSDAATWGQFAADAPALAAAVKARFQATKHPVLATIHPDGDRLVIESWRPGDGIRRTERA